MKSLFTTLWIESLKMRRSKVPLFTGIGFSMIPMIGGLFMIILKDPLAAQRMGLISTKAQLMAGVADWPTYFNLLAQAVSVGGGILFSIVTAWVFGREFADRTVKEILANPTSREAIVTAKMMLSMAWGIILTITVIALGVVVGKLIVIPGWSAQLFWRSCFDILGAASLTIALLPFVALLASIGRGYLPPIGWTILTVAFAQVAAVMGWGDWFPWSVPALFSGAAGPRDELLAPHSYVLILLTGMLGLSALFIWWRIADQTR